MVNLIDYIAELGLDAGKDYLNERKNQKEVKKKIKEFVESQSKIHELASLAEEIDFDGLAEYMKGNLLEDIQKRLFGVNKEERRIAREQIFSKGKIKIGDKYLKEFNISVIEYANRHQIPITMEIQQAKKYLGTIEDPIQHEAVDLLGQELVIPPKPFPDAVPCKLCIDDHVEFDYLLLRIQEIEDDETVVITNKEQANCPFIFIFRINFKIGTLKFTISKENLTNFELLQYTKFIAKIHEGAILKLKRLDENCEIECPLNELDYISEFSSIENEIDFLEKVVTIEKYYKNPLALPEDILFEDYKVISYMADLINGKEVERKWTEAAFSFDLCDSTKKSILNMKDEVFYFYFKAVVTVELYEETYQLPIIRTYHQARIRNLPRLLQKVKVLDNGDRLKIVVIPDSKECPSIYTDVLETEENKIR